MNLPSRIGHDALDELEGLLHEIAPRSVFLVTGRTSYERSGAKERIASLLSRYNVAHFVVPHPNPNVEFVTPGIERFREAAPDVVVAIGGGSALDTAKLICFLGSNHVDPGEYLEKGLEVARDKVPLIAIPTTSGSGAEATHFAVLYVGHTKHSVAHASMLPDAVLVDPGLCVSLPPYTTAATGMDALSQAIESYWNVHSTEDSRQLARRALDCIVPHLSNAVNEPTPAARLAMAEGANLAGRAINLTKTTAPHAVSYPITAHFGVAHGHAVALTLPSFLAYNADVTDADAVDPRGRDHVRRTLAEIANALGADSVPDARATLDRQIEEIGLERHLAALGVKHGADLDTIVAEGFNPERAGNNPRRIDPPALRRLLEALA